MYQYTLELYKNKSDNNVLNKVLTDKCTISGLSRVEVDTLAPVVDISGVNINEFNYCYIQELQRYYYITKTVINPNGIARLSLRVDVLMTYADDIRASRGLITKQEEYNPYYGDYDIEAKTQQVRLDFENAFSLDGEYVLVALRG